MTYPYHPKWTFPAGLQRIMGVKYSFPANLRLSGECLDLIRQIFVANPAKRVTLKGLKQHPWFLQNLPDELKVRCCHLPIAVQPALNTGCIQLASCRSTGRIVLVVRPSPRQELHCRYCACS
jgi:hypothetical protein